MPPVDFIRRRFAPWTAKHGSATWDQPGRGCKSMNDEGFMIETRLFVRHVNFTQNGIKVPQPQGSIRGPCSLIQTTRICQRHGQTLVVDQLSLPGRSNRSGHRRCRESWNRPADRCRRGCDARRCRDGRGASKAVVAIRQRPSLWWPISRAARCRRQWLRQNAGPGFNAGRDGEFRARAGAQAGAW
jgi:hypothetical protein